MALILKNAIAAFTASREWDNATLGRLAYWANGPLGERDVAEITPDDVDGELVALAQRGKLAAGKGFCRATGEGLAGSTVNRYLSQLGSVYQFLHAKRAIKRSVGSPTRVLKREPEPFNTELYLRPEEVDKAVAMARVLDRRWGKMATLITLAHDSGFRVGSILEARGRDLDWKAGTLFVGKAKNGDPIVAPLLPGTMAELKKLPKVGPDERLFGSKAGKRFSYRALWNRIAKACGFPEKNFHQQLLMAAGQRWPDLNMRAQDYTRAGREWFTRLIRKPPKKSHEGAVYL